MSNEKKKPQHLLCRPTSIVPVERDTHMHTHMHTHMCTCTHKHTHTHMVMYTNDWCKSSLNNTRITHDYKHNFYVHMYMKWWLILISCILLYCAVGTLHPTGSIESSLACAHCKNKRAMFTLCHSNLNEWNFNRVKGTQCIISTNRLYRVKI